MLFIMAEAIFFCSSAVGSLNPSSLSQIFHVGDLSEYQSEPTAMAATAAKKTAR